MELWTAFTIGALGSLHCAGMCGPIALAVPVLGRSKTAAFLSRLLYNTGRIVTYAAMGGFFGTLGYGVAIWGTQQSLSIIIGVAIVFSVILPFSLKRFFNINAVLTGIIGKIKKSMGLLFGKKDAHTIFLIGFLNGFLPCGLVYLGIAGAVASGSVTDGVLYMSAFGLGTLPMLLAISYLGKLITPGFRGFVRKSLPIVVLFLGFLFIMRGLNLGIPYLSPKANHAHSVSVCQ
ncbi:MAG: sulfite exporter TauE/SafE family protein [Bacteroidota bacterium]